SEHERVGDRTPEARALAHVRLRQGHGLRLWHYRPAGLSRGTSSCHGSRSRSRAGSGANVLCAKPYPARRLLKPGLAGWTSICFVSRRREKGSLRQALTKERDERERAAGVEPSTSNPVETRGHPES